MLGRNHLVAGTGVALGISGLVAKLAELDSNDEFIATASSNVTKISVVLGEAVRIFLTKTLDVVSSAAQWVWDYVFVYQNGYQMVLYLLLGFLLFWLGSLFPDMDTKNSMLGRYVTIPGPHRGPTHTDWIPLGLLFVSIFEPLRVIVFLALGIAIHNELDGWSTAGRARFWPLGKWKLVTYKDGETCVVVNNPRRITYSTGSAVELVFVLSSVALGVFGSLALVSTLG